MSGIFGFINLDGRPAGAEDFQKMADEMSGWGPDGVGSIISGSAAFGHALLIVTHESRFEKMPIHDQDEGILFTTAARLDNRDELCDLFSIPHPARPVTSDGQLVLRAYKKWGSESCKHIFGDWSFAAWHIKEQGLFLARDHLGNTGLYYYFKPPLIAFASNPKALLAHHQVPCKLDEIQMARKLGLVIEDQEPHRTYWQDARTLPVGHTVFFNNMGKKIESFWRIEDAPNVHFPNDRDYLDGFLDHFRRAVRVRLNSIRPIGTTLSAGLDSSSVTALAALALQRENKRLVAYTSIPLHPVDSIFPGRLTNEWQLAHLVSEDYTNIDHIPIRSEDISPLAAVKKSLMILNEPQNAAANMFWIISMFENAKRRNIGVMLTGQLGNGGVSWSGGRDYIFYLFARKQWQKGSRALTAWKKHHGFSWFRTVKSQLLRPMFLPLRNEYQRFLHSRKQKSVFFTYPSQDFLTRMHSHAIKDRPQYIRLDPVGEQLFIIRNIGASVGQIWNAFGTFYNMEVRDPTADVRLIEFCVGVPNEQYTFEGGNKMLIRRAMAGILPDVLRLNDKGGSQAADILPRLFEQHDELEKEFCHLESSHEVANYIDVPAMKAQWKSLMLHLSANPRPLLRAINTGYFLLQHFEDKNVEF